MNAPPGLRPRTVGEILDASFVLYRRRFGTLLLAATLLSVPTMIGAMLLSNASGDAFAGYMGAFSKYLRAAGESQGRFTPAMRDSVVELFEKSGPFQFYALLNAGLQAVSRGGASVACAFAVAAVLRREPVPGAWTLTRLALPRLAAATLVHLFLTAVETSCSICFPVVFVCAAIFAPACAAIALETGPWESEVLSWRLPTGLGWLRALVLPFATALDGCVRCTRLSWHALTIVRGSFAVLTLLVFVSTVVNVVAGAGGLLDQSFGTWFVLNHWAEVLFLPILGVAFALWFFDLRVRREGIDFAEPAVA